MTNERTKYIGISIHTAVEIGFENSKGEPYKLKSLFEDRRRFFSKNSQKARNEYDKKSQNLKIKRSEFDKLMKNYREKGLEEVITKYDIDKSQETQTLKEIRKKGRETVNALNKYKKTITIIISKKDDLEEIIQEQNKTIQKNNKIIQKQDEDLKNTRNEINSYEKSYLQSKTLAKTEKTRLETLKKEIKKSQEEKISEKNKTSELKNDISILENDYNLYKNASENLASLKKDLVITKLILERYKILTKIKAIISNSIKPFFIFTTIFLISVFIFMLFPLAINLYSQIKEIDFNFTKNKSEISQNSKIKHITYLDTVTIPIKTKAYNNIKDKDKWYFTDTEITGKVEDIITENNNKYVKLKNIIPYFLYDLDY